MITIVNYEMGNLTSVKNAFEYLGYNVKIAQNNLDIQNADKLVLPGVGSYKMAMENIHRLGILKCIQKKVEQKCPILQKTVEKMDIQMDLDFYLIMWKSLLKKKI